MKTVTFRIWTRIAESYHNNRYIKRVSDYRVLTLISLSICYYIWIIQQGNKSKINFNVRLNGRGPFSEYIYTGCDRNTSQILNCHLCGASELKQVIMVAPSCRSISFIKNITGTGHLFNGWQKKDQGNRHKKIFHSYLDKIKTIFLLVDELVLKFSTSKNIDFLFGTASFWRNMK